MKPVSITVFASVQGKAFQFAEYTMYTGDPEYYKKGSGCYPGCDNG